MQAALKNCYLLLNCAVALTLKKPLLLLNCAVALTFKNRYLLLNCFVAVSFNNRYLLLNCAVAVMKVVLVNSVMSVSRTANSLPLRCFRFCSMSSVQQETPFEHIFNSLPAKSQIKLAT